MPIASKPSQQQLAPYNPAPTGLPEVFVHHQFFSARHLGFPSKIHIKKMMIRIVPNLSPILQNLGKSFDQLLFNGDMDETTHSSKPLV